jgi:basic amino acid/polyamine antiporter, APA family
MGLWSRKSVTDLQAEASVENEHTLKRSLGALNLTLLGIGAIIGAGIFVLTGSAAAQYAGPGVVFSFIIAGFGCLFAGLCYAEFAAMIPVAGSAYTYAYATMGELMAWIIGWDLMLEYLFGAATVAVGWSGYFVAFLTKLGIHIPVQFAEAPFAVIGTHTLVPAKFCVDPATGTKVLDAAGKVLDVAQCAAPNSVVQGVMNLPAVLLLVLVSTLLVIGIKESTRFNNIIVAVKMTIVLLVIFFGFKYINAANYDPFIPPNTGVFGEYGWSGILRASGVVFFAYIGFDAVSTAAGEAKNPQKDMPVGMLLSLAICTVLYIAMALTITGMVSYKDLNVPHPIDVAVSRYPALSWLAYFVDIGAIAGLASVVLVMLFGQTRVFYSMARDGLLPKVFGVVHPKFRTPHITTIICGLLSISVAGILPVGLLGELVSIGTLLAFVLVSIGIIVLRNKQPDLPRPFRTPLVPLVPILGVLICGVQILGLPMDTKMRLVIWLAIGFVVYFGYSKSHSKLGRAEAGLAPAD